ncbi:MAG: metal ABC transporter ATP-binding protein [bacterium]
MFVERSPLDRHPSGMPALEMRDVVVEYGEQRALDGVSFALERGQRLAVVGPNGAGKSTLFKVVAGLVRPQRGGVEIFGSRPGEHICIGYVPQRSQIDWSFPVTVADVVMMGRVGKIGLFRHPSRRDWAAVREALGQVGMADLANRQIGELSGGQQQRVFIARALAQNASLLLLDEPFTGLDVPSREAIFEALDLLGRMEVTVLVATHDLNIAAERFGRAMLLNRRVISFGPPAQALATPHLLETFGGHMRVLQSAKGEVVMADTCCSGGQEEGR